jgi:hypothetical protein
MGLSCGVPTPGDRVKFEVEFEFDADTRRMVVFSGPVVLPEGAGVGCPG